MTRGPVRIDTLALQRDLWSDASTVAPAAAADVVAHGDPDQAIAELRVYLAEVLGGARPVAVSRHLLPPDTQLLLVSVPLVHGEAADRHRVPAGDATIGVSCVIVPERGGEGGVRGRWVFVPALDHTFYVDREGELEARCRGEIVRLLAAGLIDSEGWLRLLPPAGTELVPLDVLVAAPEAPAGSREALLEAARRRRAEEVLDGIGTRRSAAVNPEGLIGRDRELGELTALLGGRERLSVLLVGDEGVGKSALLDAWTAAARRRPLWATSTAQLVAGASGLGEWQERVGAVLAAAETLDAVLYLDDFGALFAERPEAGGVDVASLLRRWVTASRVRVVGELTGEQALTAERRDVALIGAMTALRLAPLDAATTVAACRQRVQRWARSQPDRPRVAEDALPRLVELATRYLPYRVFPGKALRFLDELRATREGERDPTGAPRTLGADDVYEAFGVATGIPAFLLRDDRALRVEHVVERIRSRMIGQDEAVRRVAETVCIVKAQLQPADKPLATFLFVGPTGVGKTELARSLAAFLFGSVDRLVRFDMSEYADGWAAERLIRGSASGDGLLTAKVREQPFSVVLLDEIEKAHPAVFDLLLQVLGEGRLTDARSRTTYFHNAIIILTSNLGARGGRAALGLAAGDASERDRRAELDRYHGAVAEAFRPELVNRLDKVVAFHRLGGGEVARIAALAVARLAERRGLTQAGIALDVSPAALARLAAGGTSPEHGARALRRHLHDALIAPIARLLARLGPEAKGGIVVVRDPDQPGDDDGQPVGSRLASIGDGVRVSIYRRSAVSGRRALRGALAVCAARRDTDRDLAHPLATAIGDQLTWLRAQLIIDRTPGKRQRKDPLSSDQRTLMTIELARLSGADGRAAVLRTEIRAAEELALTALASDGDAEELAQTAAALRRQFRRHYFWLLTARQSQRRGVTLSAHGIDHAAGVERWARAVLETAAAHRWRAHVHLRQTVDRAPDWPGERSWGPPRPPEWLYARLAAGTDVRSLLLRIDGDGAPQLLGLEAGLHRFHGVGKVNPCHVHVDTVAPRVDFSDEQWLGAALAAAWPTAQAKGPAAREYEDDAVWIVGKKRQVDIPWSEYPARLEEVAVEHLLASITGEDEDDGDGDIDALYQWSLDQQVAAAEAAGDGEAP